MKTLRTRTISHIAFAGQLLASVTQFSMAQTAGRNAAPGGSPDGNWIGTTQINAYAIPFHLEVASVGDQVTGALINGKEKFLSSNGTYTAGHLVLHFDYYANTIDADIHDGILSGTFSGRNRTFPITAQLNGKPLNKPWFQQADVADGGTLVLEMGDTPNTSWGSAPLDAPPSMTTIVQ